MNDTKATGEKLVLVLDIPVDTTADEAERLLNVNCEAGFYIAAIVPWPGVGARAFLKRYAAKGAPTKPPVNGRNGKQAEAVQYIKDNPDMTLRALAAGLQTIGFKRGPAWCHNKRVELRAASATLEDQTH
jgi:hypothetical protein